MKKLPFVWTKTKVTKGYMYACVVNHKPISVYKTDTGWVFKLYIECHENETPGHVKGFKSAKAAREAAEFYVSKWRLK